MAKIKIVNKSKLGNSQTNQPSKNGETKAIIESPTASENVESDEDANIANNIATDEELFERLKALQGLRELDILTEDEYMTKRVDLLQTAANSAREILFRTWNENLIKLK